MQDRLQRTRLYNRMLRATDVGHGSSKLPNFILSDVLERMGVQKPSYSSIALSDRFFDERDRLLWEVFDQRFISFDDDQNHMKQRSALSSLLGQFFGLPRVAGWVTVVHVAEVMCRLEHMISCRGYSVRHSHLLSDDRWHKPGSRERIVLGKGGGCVEVTPSDWVWAYPRGQRSKNVSLIEERRTWYGTDDGRPSFSLFDHAIGLSSSEMYDLVMRDCGLFPAHSDLIDSDSVSPGVLTHTRARLLLLARLKPETTVPACFELLAITMHSDAAVIGMTYSECFIDEFLAVHNILSNRTGKL